MWQKKYERGQNYVRNNLGIAAACGGKLYWHWITKEVYSLFIGIVTGALIYTGFSPIATLDTVINEGFINSVADAWNIGIFMFLILLG